MRTLFCSVFFTALFLAASVYPAHGQELQPVPTSSAANEPLPTLEVAIPANAGTRMVKRKGINGSYMTAVDSNSDAKALYVSSAQTLKSGYIYSSSWSPCTEDSPFLLQGGFDIDPNVSIVASTRKNSSTWGWTFINISGSDRKVTLYAVCTDSPSYAVNSTSKTLTSIAVGSSFYAIPSCEGMSLVSYGFSVKAADGSTPLSGHINNMAVSPDSEGEPGFWISFYNSSSTPIYLTGTATCITDIDDWWGSVYVDNTYSDNKYTLAPNTTYSYSRSCTSDKDTLGGGISFDNNYSGQNYDLQASKVKILGDYFQLSGSYAYWRNRVQNKSSDTLYLNPSLACGYDVEL